MAGASQLLTAAHHLHGWPKLSLSSLISNPGPKSGLVPLGSLIREVITMEVCEVCRSVILKMDFSERGW